MLVGDGLIEKMFIEPNKPGDPFEVCDADTMFSYIAPNAKLPPQIALLTKPGCPFCRQAKDLLQEHGLARGYARRNDVATTRHCERSEAIQAVGARSWIAASRPLLAMTQAR